MNMLRQKLFGAAVVALSMEVPAIAATITVDPDTSSSATYHTLKEALNNAKDGDIVQCAAGIYNSGTICSGDTGWAYRRGMLSKKTGVQIIGAGVGKSIILGAPATGTTGSIGANAVSGIQLHYCTNTVISGFTFKECYTTGSDVDRVRSDGAGVVNNLGTGNFVVDCEFDTCKAVYGGAIAGFVADASSVIGGSDTAISAVRCRFLNCYTTVAAHVAFNAKLYYCVVTGIFDENREAVRSSTLVNCSFLNNRFHHPITKVNAYNTLFARKTYRIGNGGGAETIYSCIESDVKADAGVAEGDSNNKYGQDDFYVYNMFTNDYRLLSSAVAVGAGTASYLNLIPEAYRYKDYLGNTVDPEGAVNVGASASVSSVVKPTGSILLFTPNDNDQKIVIDGVTNSFNTTYYTEATIKFYFGTDYPKFTTAEFVKKDGVEEFWLAEKVKDYTPRYPDADGKYVFMSAPFKQEKPYLKLSHSLISTNNVLYVDAASQADTPDGTVGNEYKTIQDAIDSTEDASTTYAIIKVAEGVYADGGAKLTAGDITSRVSFGNRHIRLIGAGADKTFIVGAAHDGAAEEEYGCGDNAVRCLASASGSQIRGFTLTGGHTAYAASGSNRSTTPQYYGAAVLADGMLTLDDCVISNNVSCRIFASALSENDRAVFRRCVIVDNANIYEVIMAMNFASASSLWANNRRMPTFKGEETTPIFGGYEGDPNGYLFDSTIYAPACKDSTETYRRQGVIGWCQQAVNSAKTYFRNSIIAGSIRTSGITAPGCVIETKIPNISGTTYTDSSTKVAAIGSNIAKFGDIENNELRLLPNSGAKDQAVWLVDDTNSPAYVYTTCSLDGVWPDFTGATKRAAGCYQKFLQIVNSGEYVSPKDAVIGAGDSITFTALPGMPFKQFTVNGVAQPQEVGTYSFTYTRPDDSTEESVSIGTINDTNWYVDGVNGSDDGYGTSDKPLAKVSVACRGSVSGDTIYVAPGEYTEGSVTQSVAYCGANTFIGARALVKSGVTVVATGSAAETILFGKMGSDSYGFGTGAERCVVVEAGGLLKGFTLSGGRTRIEYNDNGFGGGALCANGSTARITDCVFTNCYAYLAGASQNGSFDRCKFIDCRCSVVSGKEGNTAAVRTGTLRNCYFNHNRGQWVVDNVTQLDSCTFGSDNTNDYEGKKAGTDVSRFQGTSVNNTMFCGNNFGIKAANVVLNNCRIGQHQIVGDGKDSASLVGCMSDSVTWVLDANGYPVLGVNTTIDKGNSAVYDTATMGTVDCDGNPRFVNGGKLDIGCFEVSWLEAYSEALGSNVTVTKADSEVELTDDGVVMPANAKLSFEIPTPNSEKVNLVANVSGALIVSQGETQLTVISGSGRTVLGGSVSEGKRSYDLAMFEPGEATLKRCSVNRGGLMLLIK